MKNYHCIPTIDTKMCSLSIGDHLTGFDENLHSLILTQLVELAYKNNCKIIYTAYILPDTIKNQYPDLSFYYKEELVGMCGWEELQNYQIHPEINYKNFICSFNGSAHVSRKLLVAILKKFGYFSFDYCSKNFSYTPDIVDGHLLDYVGTDETFYRKFFISNESTDFCKTVNSFGNGLFEHNTQFFMPHEHTQNMNNLEFKITESFLNIVSETMATSYYPFVTEKFLYSIVTRGLFLSYAQPGWHTHVEKYYGFKKYNKLFDYRFDTIQNPVKRLVEMITMISKFSRLSVSDWHDLYLLEQDTIEYNRDHYFSLGYRKYLDQQQLTSGN